MAFFAPVLNVLARVMVGYAAMFLIPLAWGWTLDAPEVRNVWWISMAVTLTMGFALWGITMNHHHEPSP